ncbi:hypothetical protein F5B22DRAFT_367772 [Xylaria bambusicola]|uniref:uncharacterized protein n=1 Tax=Xylaria bambusicola TaxID=326684 RepID=UPI0020082E58|nr:uncharacterized protein F5B22DRAFT_367772 [Xylaria bambusicola]KAI0509241.1 hypothetical protein F5B22DRAFT_367772 [Xylaria bambusicola]
MSSTNRIDIALIEDGDMPACFKIVSETFGHDAPFVDIYFPNHDTSYGQVQGSSRLLAWKHASRDSVFLKAVTSVDGDRTSKDHIVGLAVWTHMKAIPPQKLEDAENVEEIWPDMNDRKFMTALWEDYVRPRSQAVRDSNGNGVYVLELLAVHPRYQRLGAGAALVSWGTRAADEAGVKAVVEGTPAGRRLYEKCGFSTEIEEMSFNIGEGFAGRRIPKLIFLVREPAL